MTTSLPLTRIEMFELLLAGRVVREACKNDPTISEDLFYDLNSISEGYGKGAEISFGCETESEVICVMARALSEACARAAARAHFIRVSCREHVECHPRFECTLVHAVPTTEACAATSSISTITLAPAPTSPCTTIAAAVRAMLDASNTES